MSFSELSIYRNLFSSITPVGKKLYSDLNQEERELLIQIIITCTAKITNILSEHSNPEEYAKLMTNHIDKKKNFIGIKLFTELPNIHPEEIYTRIDLKKIISIDNITDSTFSKVYTEFEDRKLLKNITSKKDIKDFRTKEFHNKGKKRTYKTAGRISFYQKEPKIDKVIEIISKPGSVEYINDTINKYSNGLINKFLKFYYTSFIYLLENNSNSLEFYAKSFSKFDRTIQLDLNSFEELRMLCYLYLVTKLK